MREAEDQPHEQDERDDHADQVEGALPALVGSHLSLRQVGLPDRGTTSTTDDRGEDGQPLVAGDAARRHEDQRGGDGEDAGADCAEDGLAVAAEQVSDHDSSFVVSSATRRSTELASSCRVTASAAMVTSTSTSPGEDSLIR